MFPSEFPRCLHSCHALPYECLQCRVHTHLSACGQRRAYLRPADALIFFSFAAQTVCFPHLCSPLPSHSSATAGLTVPACTSRLRPFEREHQNSWCRLYWSATTNIWHTACKNEARWALLHVFPCFPSIPASLRSSPWGPARPPGSQELPCEEQGVNHR